MYVRSVNVTVTGLVAGARRRFLAKKAAQVIIFEVKHKSSQVAGLGTVPVSVLLSLPIFSYSFIYCTGELSWRVLPVFSSSTTK